MKHKLIISIIGLILLISLVLAQPFVLPSTFTINPNFAGLPSPQPNQYIFGCKYEFPIQLRDVNVYDYNVVGQNLNLNASFSLYTGNKKSACGVKQQIITVNLADWQNSLASLITTNSQNNITTRSNNQPNPISQGGAG